MSSMIAHLSDLFSSGRVLFLHGEKIPEVDDLVGQLALSGKAGLGRWPILLHGSLDKFYCEVLPANGILCEDEQGITDV